MDLPSFQVWDYLVFCALLVVSAAIGVYHACTGGKQSTTNEFLLADKKMGIAPVAMSMLASFMSAIVLMGNPAEVYKNGSQYIVIGLSYLLVIPAAAHVYIPVFYDLNLTSAYEYLELRFSKGVRLAACLTFSLQMVFYMAIVLYAPALALNQVTGLNVWLSVLSMGVVCTFYTALGGMRAVMWTDLVQIIVMFAGILVILVKGSLDNGGVAEIWRVCAEGDRLELFNFDPDPRVRHTTWTLVMGGTFTWLAIYGVNQAQVQRALSCPSLRNAQISLYMNVLGLLGLLILTVGCGLVIFAHYQGCDPVTLGRVRNFDQIVPLYVMETLGAYPGLPGLFVAAIFSGALSTLSSGFNSLALSTLQDIIKNYWWRDVSDKRATLVAKLLAVGYGLLCIALTYVASLMGGILQAAIAVFGIIGGPLLGVFTLGMFFPWANWKGAYTGLFCSLTLTMWMGLGNVLAYPSFTPSRPLSISDCPVTLTNSSEVNSIMYNVTYSASAVYHNTTSPAVPALRPAIAELYSVSHLYYSLIAVTVSIIVGLLVSFLTGAQSPSTLDPKLITPVIRRLLRGFLHTHDHHCKNVILDAEIIEQKVRLAESKELSETGNNSDKFMHSSHDEMEERILLSHRVLSH